MTGEFIGILVLFVQNVVQGTVRYGKIILIVGKNQCLRIVRGTIQQMSIIIRCDYLIVYRQLGKYYRRHGVIL